MVLRVHDASELPDGKYSVDHFTNNAKTWRRFVLSFFSREKQIKVLHIGGHKEGMEEAWLVKNMPSISKITVCDGGGVSKVFENNIAAFKQKVERFQKRENITKTLLDMASQKTDYYDLVYIDGFPASDALHHAVLGFMLLRPGGMVVFDDYTHSREHNTACPRRGIDAFIDARSSFIKTVHQGWQLIAIKRKRLHNVKKCMSEYYHENVFKA